MIPLISFIVPLSFTAGIFGTLLGKPGAFVGTICLKAVDGLLWIVHKLPSKAIVCGKPELWQMIIFIAIFVCGSFLVGKRRKTGQALLVFGCLFPPAFYVRPLPKQSGSGRGRDYGWDSQY